VSVSRYLDRQQQYGAFSTLMSINTHFFVLQICVQALFLGLAMAAGLFISVLAPASWKPFGW